MRRTLCVVFIQLLKHAQLWLHGVQHTRHPCPSLLPDFVQTHIHWVSDAIQPSHLLSPPSPPAFNLSQFSGSIPMSWLFPSGGLSFGASASASVLPMSFQDWFPLGLTGLFLLLSQELSRVYSSITVWKHQFLGTQPCLWFNSHIRTWWLEKP